MKYIKTFESIARAKSFIGNKMQQYEKLKQILSKNPGYVGQMTEWLFDEKIPLDQLENLYNKIINLKRNGRSIQIDNKEFEKVVDEVIKNEQQVDVYRIVNRMSTNAKTLVKNKLQEPYSQSTFDMFYSISKKDPEFIQKFLSRSASFKSLSDIDKYYRILNIGVINTKEAIKEKIEGLKNSTIVYDQDNILVLQVGTYEDMKQIGNDCTWCIVQYESSWKIYCLGRHQFVVWNFNLQEFESLFKIGITMNNNSSIHSAFDYMNRSCEKYAEDLVKNINLKPSHDQLEKIKRDEETRNVQYLENLVNGVRHTTSGKELREIYWGRNYSEISIRSLKNIEIKKDLCLKMARNFFGSLNINSEGLTRVKNLTDIKYEHMIPFLSELFNNKNIIYKEDLDKITPNFYMYFLRNYGRFGNIGDKVFEEAYRSGKNTYVINEIVNSVNDDGFISISRLCPYWLNELTKKMESNKILIFKEFFKSILEAKSRIGDMNEGYFNNLKHHFHLFEKIYKRIKKTKTLQKTLKIEFNLLKALFGDKIDKNDISPEDKRTFWFIYGLQFEVKQPMNFDTNYIPHIDCIPLGLIDFDEKQKFEVEVDHNLTYKLKNIIRFSEKFRVVINIRSGYINDIDFRSYTVSDPTISSIYTKLLKLNKKFIPMDTIELIPDKLELKVT